MKRLADREIKEVIIATNPNLEGEATATYDLAVSRPDRTLPDEITRHVASVVYEYQPSVLAREKDRLENPLGFVVTAYRSDPEINTPVVAAKP